MVSDGNTLRLTSSMKTQVHEESSGVLQTIQSQLLTVEIVSDQPRDQTSLQQCSPDCQSEKQHLSCNNIIGKTIIALKMF